MPPEEKPQAATNPVNGQGTPAPENVGEQASEPTLDDTLKQYADETKQGEAAPQPPQPGEQQPPAQTGTPALEIDQNEFAALRAAAREVQAQQLRDTVAAAAVKMREVGGDALSIYDNQALEDALNGAAQRDPRVSVAFAQRISNPSGWNDVVSAVGRNLVQRASQIADPGLTADRATARASGQGISPTTGEKTGSWADDWNSIPEEERLKRMKEHGYDPNKQFIV